MNFHRDVNAPRPGTPPRPSRPEPSGLRPTFTLNLSRPAQETWKKSCSHAVLVRGRADLRQATEVAAAVLGTEVRAACCRRRFRTSSTLAHGLLVDLRRHLRADALRVEIDDLHSHQSAPVRRDPSRDWSDGPAPAGPRRQAHHDHRRLGSGIGGVFGSRSCCRASGSNWRGTLWPSNFTSNENITNSAFALDRVRHHAAPRFPLRHRCSWRSWRPGSSRGCRRTSPSCCPARCRSTARCSGTEWESGSGSAAPASCTSGKNVAITVARGVHHGAEVDDHGRGHPLRSLRRAAASPRVQVPSGQASSSAVGAGANSRLRSLARHGGGRRHAPRRRRLEALRREPRLVLAADERVEA